MLQKKDAYSIFMIWHLVGHLNTGACQLIEWVGPKLHFDLLFGE